MRASVHTRTRPSICGEQEANEKNTMARKHDNDLGQAQKETYDDGTATNGTTTKTNKT